MITEADHIAADAEFARMYPGRRSDTHSGFKLWMQILTRIVKARQ